MSEEQPSEIAQHARDQDARRRSPEELRRSYKEGLDLVQARSELGRQGTAPVDATKAIFVSTGLLFRLIYSLVGLGLGFACVIGGIVLFLHDITEYTSWTTKVLGAASYISDAVPGIMLFVGGLCIVWITRFSVKTRKR